MLERTNSGNVTINDTLLRYAEDDLPLGGIGLSQWNMTGALRPPSAWLSAFVTRILLR